MPAGPAIGRVVAKRRAFAEHGASATGAMVVRFDLAAERASAVPQDEFLREPILAKLVATFLPSDLAARLCTVAGSFTPSLVL